MEMTKRLFVEPYLRVRPFFADETKKEEKVSMESPLGTAAVAATGLRLL